ncbi:MAG TPA: ABC transporter ATP-binding protein [Acetobacteraceae bacterium]|jgi:ABC-type branched-subunit amino acid transport system ATPase component|nr:ABC transporter ATP-binding protein [Acetobacteraceae bacterium]
MTSLDSRAPLLVVRGLSKEFGGLRALQAIDLDVEAGEIVGIIGPNGSGKTTFFNVLSGIHPATSGTIRFAEHADISRLPPHRVTRCGIARTFQNQRLFNQMTVLENVLAGMVPRTKAGLLEIMLALPGARAEQAAAERQALELLRLFGPRLAPRRDRPAISLSYANRRRLEIARALATGPRLLLLDEPAAGMNPSETRELMADIRRIRDSGLTILVIEHDLRVVKGICSRVVAFDHGVKITEGSFAEVRSHPAVIEAYLGHRAAAAA